MTSRLWTSELLGTAVLTACALRAPALVTGLVLGVLLVLAGGEAHLNPAITLGALHNGRLAPAQALPRVFFQVAGGLVGGWIALDLL